MTEIIEFLIDNELVILCSSFLILISLYIALFYRFISAQERYYRQEAENKINLSVIVHSPIESYINHDIAVADSKFLGKSANIFVKELEEDFNLFQSELLQEYEATKNNIKFSRAPKYDERRVEFSVFAPKRILKNKKFLLEIWAYYENEYDYVLSNTNKFGLNKELSSKHGLRIPTESVLLVAVAIKGLEIDEAIDRLIWTGHATNAQFIVNVPLTVKSGDYPGSVTISCSGLVIAKMRFIISIEDFKSENLIDITTEKFYPLSAFASYATDNRAQVLERIHGMQKVRPDLEIYLDVISLRSGDNWLEKLEEHVPTKDIFYLFWSSYAARSKWVKREWKLALTRRGLDYISPAPIGDIRDAPPPRELKSLHFSDPINPLIAYENSRTENH